MKNRKQEYTGGRGPGRARWLIWVVLAILMFALALMRWGGYLLVATDDTPAHTEAAVVLQGSIQGVKARLAGGTELLRQGTADRLLLSVPRESYWGQPIRPMAQAYILRNYPDVINRVEFCETSEAVNSTREEAEALRACIEDRRWHSVLVVTSNYHTRRAGMVWRRVLARRSPSVEVAIYGVKDQDFDARLWWRRRLYAKTWLTELIKLVWDSLERS